MSEHQNLSGPEFLEAVAHAETACGLTINAAEYQRRAGEWNADIRARDHAQREVSSLVQAAAATRRLIARAHDELSQIRPYVEQLQEYEQLRVLLASLAGVAGVRAAWCEGLEENQRDPRRMPMPGDRFYLPVEVASSVYKDSGLSISYRPMLPGESGALEARADIPFVIIGCPSWSHGAIGVVSAHRDTVAKAA